VLTYIASVQFRYVLLLNAVAALLPASAIKGRINDPLLHASWYTLQQHSAILVVSAAAVLGTALTYFIVARDLRRWWIFALSGSFTAMFPGFFYLLAAPPDDRLFYAELAMLILGLVWGALVGLTIYGVFKRQSHAPDPNNRIERARER